MGKIHRSWAFIIDDPDFLYRYPHMWLEHKAYSTFKRCGNRRLGNFYFEKINSHIDKDHKERVDKILWCQKRRFERECSLQGRSVHSLCYRTCIWMMGILENLAARVDNVVVKRFLEWLSIRALCQASMAKCRQHISLHRASWLRLV